MFRICCICAIQCPSRERYKIKAAVKLFLSFFQQPAKNISVIILIFAVSLLQQILRRQQLKHVLRQLHCQADHLYGY